MYYFFTNLVNKPNLYAMYLNIKSQVINNKDKTIKIVKLYTSGNKCSTIIVEQEFNGDKFITKIYSNGKIEALCKTIEQYEYFFINVFNLLSITKSIYSIECIERTYDLVTQNWLDVDIQLCPINYYLADITD
ncbi:hypothetical protein CE11_00173 [Megavirus courdo11]|uniref:Uncharacterized protein n=4 Tax=Megamimivirinae TaxID=3044648 RepID=A0A2L2DLI1_MIMIV|nr:hypothetical protein MegaChil _gp0173 [Megavirus chiliensis]AEQ33005.1 hypothetical protein [Megavirus chiliensis]AFX92203.1 hypothetical protein CE11_00173 [Megavirus courdo11]AGD92074.1 hypothetical protein LBA_00154 [Megavirus lba]AVG47010.1 hypothetical protein [Acanthamoeba polyphaga mimivirus]